MSMLLFSGDVLFQQRFLKSAGFYAGDLDGEWGPKTDKASADFEAKTAAIAASLGTFDQRSERCVATLHPKAQEAARRFLAKVRTGGIGDIRIISGTRSYAEQNDLYRKGRFGNPPPVVTKARGGQSNHNFGVAWDIGVFDGSGRYLGDSPLYTKAARAGLLDGIEWGGDWKGFKDMPHFQMVTGLKVSEICARFESGKAFL